MAHHASNDGSRSTNRSMVHPLPEGFELTAEEQGLMDMYATIKQYEKEAARLREKAAKDRLAAADERYKQSLSQTTNEETDDVQADSSTRKTKKKRSKKPAESSEMNRDESESESEEEDLMDSEDEKDELKRKRREEKLQGLRQDVELARQKAREKEVDEAMQREEELRAAHLNEAAAGAEGFHQLDGPTLLKKRPRDTDADEDEPGKKKGPSSLIAKLAETASTPPHDFSKSLAMTKGSLSGTVLFPSEADEATARIPSWSPPSTATSPSEGALEIELKDFDQSQATNGSGNNTVAIKFMAPADSNRYSINIAAPGHSDFHSVLFHFNPRQHEKGGLLVINDKQEGIWGQGISVPLSQLPLMFGQVSCTLIVQINGEGFDIFFEGKHCARLEHRKPLPSSKCSLTLQFPSTDDYGSPENWKVFRVWWGHKPVMATGDLSGVAGVNIHRALHPRKLFVSGLPRISTEPEVDLRRAELERAFRKYGGSQGAVVIVPNNSTFAFVEVESDRQADLAMTQMANKYRINRARRSRHEALQEERAAAEAAKEGKVTESSEWD